VATDSWRLHRGKTGDRQRRLLELGTHRALMDDAYGDRRELFARSSLVGWCWERGYVTVDGRAYDGPEPPRRKRQPGTLQLARRLDQLADLTELNDPRARIVNGADIAADVESVSFAFPDWSPRLDAEAIQRNRAEAIKLSCNVPWPNAKIYKRWSK
jgi:hypothetical protein